MKPNHIINYEPRSVIFSGAAGGFAAALFFVCAWFFVSGEDYGHPPAGFDTVDEMTAYATFFLLIFASYFIAAFIVHYFRGRLVECVPAWLAVSVLGSVLFAVALLALVSSSLQGGGEIAKTSVFYVITLSIAAGVFSRAIEFLNARRSRMTVVSNKL